MRFPSWVWAAALAVSLNSALHAGDAPADPALAQRAYGILKERCSRCHGQSAQQAGLDVLSRENLTEERGATGAKFAFIVPGDVAKSALVDAIDGGADSFMPKDGSPEAKAMTDAEKELLKTWVSSGAPFPQREVRAFISETQILIAMRTYLLNAKADDRRYLRFYTLTHLQNNPTVSELDLRLYRAALAKAVNSLSKEREIYLPQPLPETGDSVFVIDLRKLGWDRHDLWNEILSHYPYGLKYDFVKDEERQQVWKDVSQFSGADQPYLRGDWFIITATQPPLYHQLLDIPHSLMDLEHQLQLNLQENFLEDRVQRSGYAKSGVSKQNRLLERHTSPVTPYFWISYDFLPKRAKGDLTRFPLGPLFDNHPYRNQAFEQDGGELIWSLPNGLQAYMLIKANGDRIDAGPIEVVFDRSAVLGTPSIINGISCIYCHREGMIPDFRDEIRGSDTLGGNAYKKVLALYPPHEEMQTLVRQDQEVFMRSLEKVIGPYLKVGENANRSIRDFPEPVGKVAEMYSRDLTPQDVALELGIEKVETLQAMITANRELLRFGLGTMTLNPPGTLKREKWETQDGTSLMQDVSSELRMGLPFTPPRRPGSSLKP